MCVKVCTRAVEAPEEADVLGIIRIPKNLPLSVIGTEVLEANHLRKLRSVPWRLYQRKNRITRIIPASKRIV